MFSAWCRAREPKPDRAGVLSRAGSGPACIERCLRVGWPGASRARLSMQRASVQEGEHTCLLRAARGRRRGPAGSCCVMRLLAALLLLASAAALDTTNPEDVAARVEGAGPLSARCVGKGPGRSPCGCWCMAAVPVRLPGQRDAAARVCLQKVPRHRPAGAPARPTGSAAGRSSAQPPQWCPCAA